MLDDTNNNTFRNSNKYIYKLFKIKRKYDLLSIKRESIIIKYLKNNIYINFYYNYNI